MVIHGNQPEALRQLLVHWFRVHPLSPLEDETILVQSNGIAQWLKLALAADCGDSAQAGCGIAAAFDMLLPSRFMWNAYRAVLGRQAVPDMLPFDKPMLIWRLMRLLPEQVGQEGYEPLAGFLEDDPELRKLYQLAERIADLFDQYQVYRADWLDAWARGRDELPRLNGEPAPLDDANRWQAMLWRALLADTGAASQTSRAAVHQRFLEIAATLSAPPPGLPRRISVFGLSSLPGQSLQALLAMSKFTQVLLCVHNPCEMYWADLLSSKDLARRHPGRHQRKTTMPETLADEDLHLHAHPLLASWGKQGRDYIALLDEFDDPEKYRPQFAAIGERIDLFQSHLDGKPANLLNQLQEDIRLLTPAGESRQRAQAIDPAADRSIRFHIAHSSQREVEILHDQLLAAFSADPELAPKDIIVMVPDINQYAPHIEAVFGQIDPSDSRYIAYSIADLAGQQQAPFAFALEFLLHVSESRLTVSDLLDLLDVAAIRDRFAIAPEELPRLRRWIEQANIRWGLNGEHRIPFFGEACEQNSWIHGLKRMLLGYAVGGDPSSGEEDQWHGIEPYGEVAGLEAALLGPLSSLLIKLETLAKTLETPATPVVWGERLQSLLDDFFRCDSPEDASLMLRLQGSLQQWQEACAVARLDAALPLAVVREHWLAQLDQPTLTRRFMGGQLTFATLMPMRAIPFRMVCLLGMNDGEFPRARPPVDFDLMARELRPGDRSRREDDRYLFLEALLSARERLHISWVGRSIQDNSAQPPSVLVSQLRDHLAGCWTLAGATAEAAAAEGATAEGLASGGSASEGSASEAAATQAAPRGSASSLLAALTVEHKLQAFSADYFGKTPDSSPLFTCAREWERKAPAGASAAGREEPLPPAAFESAISLDQLAAFLKEPARAFYQTRLGVFLDGEDLASEDQEPFALDPLREWSLQDELIQARLDALIHGQDEIQAEARQLARIARRGELPLGEMGSLTAGALCEPLAAMFENYRKARANWPQPLDDVPFRQSVTLAGQTVDIEGRITERFAAGDAWARLELNSSNLLTGQKYRCDKLLKAWVHHLAAHLHGQPMTTQVVGKNGMVTINPLEPEAARRHFEVLVATYLRGLSTPLPLAAKAGFAWIESGGGSVAGALHEGSQKAVEAARSKYEDGYMSTGEASQSPYLQRIYPTFEGLWANGEFSALCEALYAPLRAHVGKAKDPQ